MKLLIKLFPSILISDFYLNGMYFQGDCQMVMEPKNPNGDKYLWVKNFLKAVIQ